MSIERFLSSYQNQTWVIAVSGGPDSMALLELAHSSEVNCVVVHVNYHKRSTAERDMNIVKDYCSNHDILCFVFDAGEHHGNFQDYARNFRYARCAEVAQKYHALGVLVAHHLMDDVETYLIQKQRRSQVTHYGLKNKTTLYGIPVERPLLKVMKEELITYCEKKHIPYGIDETNLSDDYLRNRIRKELLSDESHVQLNAILDEKNKENQDLETFKNEYHYQLNQACLSYGEYEKLDYPIFYLQLWIRSHVEIKLLSEDHLIEIHRQIMQSHHFKHQLGTWRLIKQYGQICLLSPRVSYTYLLKEPIDLATPFFEIKTHADPQHSFEVIDADFPLTIRNAQTKEIYRSDDTLHSLSRWFISHKIPQSERETWPVIVNCHNEVIHIARIRIPRHLNTPKTPLYMIK